MNLEAQKIKIIKLVKAFKKLDEFEKYLAMKTGNKENSKTLQNKDNESLS